MKIKKIYKKPTVKSITLDANDIICTSMYLYNEEATVVGAKGRSSFIDNDD